jgi:hypothetical protein
MKAKTFFEEMYDKLKSGQIAVEAFESNLEMTQMMKEQRTWADRGKARIAEEKRAQMKAAAANK